MFFSFFMPCPTLVGMFSIWSVVSAKIGLIIWIDGNRHVSRKHVRPTHTWQFSFVDTTLRRSAVYEFLCISTEVLSSAFLLPAHVCHVEAADAQLCCVAG